STGMSEPHDNAPHAPRSDPAQPQSASPATPPDGGPGPRNEDDAAMDAYSRVVTTVAATLRPRVASLRVVGPRGEGAGSGVVSTDDGFLVTSMSPAGPRRGMAVARTRFSDYTSSCTDGRLPPETTAPAIAASAGRRA